jgi:imidazoleglycerol-phosphate dehydratase / histidinol-phosphatase
MLKKALFIDRDGTLISEPPADFQVDSLEKLEFMPGVIRNLYRISKNMDFEFVMVTNQDGLGTSSFPENTFWPSQEKMLKTFEGEKIHFEDILIDKTFPEENAPSRKPGTALLGKYLDGSYDLSGSFVIGDRITDVQLALNMGAKAIFFKGQEFKESIANLGLSECCVLYPESWDEIYAFLAIGERTATVSRKTAETDIFVKLELDGSGKSSVSTGLGFFDHMLDQIARHSGCNLEVKVKGDLHVDEHHTIEDTGIALGEAFYKALGSKRGIERYGFCLPMDDCLAQVSIDFGGRAWIVWEAEFKREKIGEMPTEMFYHFFKSLSDSAKMNLNIKAEGDNEHHKIEGIFKSFARAIKRAIRYDLDNLVLPSTKGSL